MISNENNIPAQIKGLAMKRITLLQTIWREVYDQTLDTEQTIRQYFTPSYIQCINGRQMDLPSYIQHVIEQKKNMTIHEIEYKTHLEDANNLFAIYYPLGLDKENDLIKAEVIAYFHFTGQQIDSIHGQVRLIQGDLHNVDM